MVSQSVRGTQVIEQKNSASDRPSVQSYSQGGKGATSVLRKVFGVQAEYQWSTAGVQWSTTGVEWSMNGVEWSKSGVGWSTSGVLG